MRTSSAHAESGCVRAALVLTACLFFACGCGAARVPMSSPPDAAVQVEVPLLAGLDMRTAFQRLVMAGLCVGDIDVAEGSFTAVRVVDQDPLAGAIVPPRTRISLTFGVPKGREIGRRRSERC
jgi:hypothetical protein